MKLVLYRLVISCLTVTLGHSSGVTFSSNRYDTSPTTVVSNLASVKIPLSGSTTHLTTPIESAPTNPPKSTLSTTAASVSLQTGTNTYFTTKYTKPTPANNNATFSAKSASFGMINPTHSVVPTTTKPRLIPNYTVSFPTNVFLSASTTLPVLSSIANFTLTMTVPSSMLNTNTMSLNLKETSPASTITTGPSLSVLPTDMTTATIVNTSMSNMFPRNNTTLTDKGTGSLSAMDMYFSSTLGQNTSMQSTMAVGKTTSAALRATKSPTTANLKASQSFLAISKTASQTLNLTKSSIKMSAKTLQLSIATSEISSTTKSPNKINATASPERSFMTRSKNVSQTYIVTNQSSIKMSAEASQSSITTSEMFSKTKLPNKVNATASPERSFMTMSKNVSQTLNMTKSSIKMSAKTLQLSITTSEISNMTKSPNEVNETASPSFMRMSKNVSQTYIVSKSSMKMSAEASSTTKSPNEVNETASPSFMRISKTPLQTFNVTESSMKASAEASMITTTQIHNTRKSSESNVSTSKSTTLTFNVIKSLSDTVSTTSKVVSTSAYITSTLVVKASISAEALSTPKKITSSVTTTPATTSSMLPGATSFSFTAMNNLLSTTILTTSLTVTHVSSSLLNLGTQKTHFSSPYVTSMVYSLSSQVSTPSPSSHEVVLVRLTIRGNCTQALVQSTEFKEAVKQSCARVLKISGSKINISNINCGSILVDVEIKNEKDENVTQILTDAVKDEKLNFNVSGTRFVVTSVKELPRPTPPLPTTGPTSESSDGDDNTALIIYIVFGSVLGLAFLIGIIALIVRCRHERSTGMFHLPSEENLELSGFSSGSKSRHGGNFYGELQPQPEEHHRIRGIPNESGTLTDDIVENSTENSGGFAGSFLPEWHNLPTMEMSDVSHEDTSNEKDTVLVTYGKTGGRDNNDSGKNNPVVFYENIGTV